MEKTVKLQNKILKVQLQTFVNLDTNIKYMVEFLFFLQSTHINKISVFWLLIHIKQTLMNT